MTKKPFVMLILDPTTLTPIEIYPHGRSAEECTAIVAHMEDVLHGRSNNQQPLTEEKK